jgi:methionyl aminopeptidase
MIIRKTPEQVDQMAAAGDILVRTVKVLKSKARPGITTLELDEAAEKFIRSQGAVPSFKGYRGFPGSICASPNSMVVHGIPDAYECKRGDILSIDVGVTKDGWVADAAVTVPIGPISTEAKRLLEVTSNSLFDGIEQRRLARDPALGRVERALGDPHPGRPRDRPRDARGAAGAELRRARSRAAAGGGHGVGDRADGECRRAAGADG